MVTTTSTERRKREKEQRRQHFIDVAEQAFLEQGYDATSIEEIAHRAEFSKRAVYLYFRNKRSLFQAVVLRGLTRLNEALRGAGIDSDSGLEALQALARAYYRFFREDRAVFDLLLDYEMRDYHFGRRISELGEYERHCQEMNDRNTRIVHEAVERAIAEGADPGSLDAAQVTLILWAQVIGILQLIARREHILETAYGLDAETLFHLSFDASLRGALGL